MGEGAETPPPAENAAEKPARISKRRNEILKAREARVSLLRTFLKENPELSNKQAELMKRLGYDSTATLQRDKVVLRREAKAQQVVKTNTNLVEPPRTLSDTQRKKLLKRIEERGSEYGSDEIMNDFFTEKKSKEQTE